MLYLFPLKKKISNWNNTFIGQILSVFPLLFIKSYRCCNLFRIGRITDKQIMLYNYCWGWGHYCQYNTLHQNITDINQLSFVRQLHLSVCIAYGRMRILTTKLWGTVNHKRSFDFFGYLIMFKIKKVKWVAFNLKGRYTRVFQFDVV